MARELATSQAFITCTHAMGIVRFEASQQFVRISGAAILVDPDTVSKKIVGCANTIPGATVACSTSLPLQRGRSSLTFIGGRPVLLSDLEGFTVCQPPLSASYSVQAGRVGQALVRENP